MYTLIFLPPIVLKGDQYRQVPLNYHVCWSLYMLYRTSKKADKFLDLLKNMNWIDKFPQKLSFKNAMTAMTIGAKKMNCTDQLYVLPYLVLQKIMMSDIRCRSVLYCSKSCKNCKCSSSDSVREDDGRIHPVDCMLAVIHCCDDILRQDMMNKLSLCRLPVPLLLPNPVDGSVTFLLWSLRSLFQGWKSLKHGGKECRIVDYKGPIVSFLRLGELQLSKSTILNNVIDDQEQFRENFFNWDSKGGCYERNFVDGLVELCCYYPSAKDTDFYSDAIIFLNLRGDAQLYPRQVEFLQKISVLSVVLIAEGNIDEDSIRMLHRFSAAPGGIVLLLDEGKGKKETKESRKKRLELLHQLIPEDKCSKVQLKNKNMATIGVKTKQKIVEKLEGVNPENFQSISTCCKFAYEASLKIDEDNKHSKAGKRMAGLVMEQVHSVHYSDVKQKLLPLQGTELWHKWAMHDKERHRHIDRKDTIVSEYNSQKDTEKMNVRKEQIKLSTTLTPLMDCFMRCLMEKDVNVRKYFFRWLKLLLDDHSKKILSELYPKYHTTKEKLMHLKKEADSHDYEIQKITEQLKQQNQELINASFGMEHLFREMGQIYESRMCSSVGNIPEKLRNEVEHLPQVMAEIMAEGDALELMDGDASHVPVSWVLAVIEKLKIVCEKDSKRKHGGNMFVISILGIQSTGKSTLLNTMFGLRFNVSAGRCTTGVYIQLLPLDSSLRKTTDCDYMLIVDSEGLRAPQLPLRGLKHDNELITFVIGIADAIIISLYGNIPGHLEDILQTTLLSFIRMREVDRRSLLIVHQNHFLELIDRKVEKKFKFLTKLKEMEYVACKAKDMHHKFFEDIIVVDDVDVYCFPCCMWNGDPPMAPVSKGYIESVLNLKNALIELTINKHWYISLKTFKLHIKTLWSAVLTETFVFDFKNVIEVHAYRELSMQFGQWSLKMQCEMLNWKHAAESNISSWGCESENIEQKLKSCYEEAEKMITVVYLKLVEEMRNFFHASEYSETLSAWKQETKHKLKKLEVDCKKEAELFYKKLLQYKLNCSKVEKSVLTEISNEVELRNGGERLCDKEFDEIFESKWQKWMEVFGKEENLVNYPSDHDIEMSVCKILSEIFPGSDRLVIKMLSDKSFSMGVKSLSIQQNHFVFRNQQSLPFKPIISSDLKLPRQLVYYLVDRLSDHLSKIKHDFKLFSLSFLSAIVKDLFSEVDKFNAVKMRNGFIFSPESKVDLALFACTHACDELIKESKKNDLMRLNRLKSTILKKFKDMRNKVSADKVATSILSFYIGAGSNELYS